MAKAAKAKGSEQVTVAARKQFQRELLLQEPNKRKVYDGLRKGLKTAFMLSWQEDPTWDFVQIYKERTQTCEPQCCARTLTRPHTILAGRRSLQ
jgi:hypothetical protein